MIGKQLVNNLLLQFITSITSYLWMLYVASHDKHEVKQQWEIDNDLIDFDSNTLMDEYLELG